MTTKIDQNQPRFTLRFSLDSGRLSLDFANTVDGRRAAQPTDNLPDYSALSAFAHQSGLLAATVAGRLAELAAHRPHEARAAHANALVLREAIFRVARELALDGAPEREDLHAIERHFAAAVAHGGFASTANGFDWEWSAAGAQLEYPLWHIAYDAFELLTREELARLRVCAADDCDWLFLDETRNRSRKWCDMSTCGNRAKVARYRKRRD